MATDSLTILKRINIKGSLGSSSGIGSQDTPEQSTPNTTNAGGSSMFASVFASAKS